MAVPGGGSSKHWGVRSKLARPPWRFLGKVAGRVGVSCLNGRDPHGSSWGMRLGGLGVPVSLHVGGMAPVSPGQAPSPWPAAGRGASGAPEHPGPCRLCLTITCPHPCSPSQGASCRPLLGAQPVACVKIKF